MQNGAESDHVNVAQEQLDQWRLFAEVVRSGVLSARQCFAHGKAEHGRDMLEQVHAAAIFAAGTLEAAGARRHETLAEPPEVALDLLASDANRRYARKLWEALEAGRAVDRERFGEGIGTDGPSQIIEMVLRNVELEIHRPTDPDE